MSIKALNWAFDQKTGSPINKSVLVLLANYADEKNRTYPSKEHIADKCECHPKTVQKVIKDLQEKGLIDIFRRSDSEQKRQISNVYILNIMGEQRTPAGGAQDSREGSAGLHRGGAHDSPDPKEKILKKDTKDYFEDFWNLYPPDKGSKQAARPVFEKKAEKYGAEFIITKTRIFGAYRRSRISEGESPTYTPRARTWLFQERFKDEITENKSKNNIAG
jgi:hypothetical protein